MSEKAHYDSVVSYMRGTRAAYTRSISRITGIWEGYPINRDVPFNIDNYPSLKKKVDAEVRRLAMNLETNIVNGVNEEWARSNFKNDQFVDMVFRNRNVPPAVMEAMKNRNMEALAGFKARTVGGMGLSDRIWVNSDKVRNEIQQAMAVGIHEGRPAADLARDMQEFLNRPDDMFRRVRDAEGNLRLSEAAKNFHPGKGVYRSSYKNAMRMTRTEINGSYRMADNTRWNQLEFILGYEIHRSQNIKADCDICDANQGKYPKDYVFVGWHPHCMCYMTSILPSEEKMDEYMDNLWDGKETQFDYINQPDIKGGLGTFDWRSQTGRQKNVYEMLATNKDTQEMYKGPDGNYTPTRQQLHNDIIKRFDDMGSTYDDQVYMLGGAPANGKSTLVDSGFLKHPAKTMMIDPDKIKGMIPEYNMMISSRDPIVRKLAAAKLHEESSYLSKIIQKNALASKKDFILDGVNDGKVEKVIGKLQAMKAQGKTIRADYCTLDTNLSLRLAEKRGRKTGRVVPTQHVANTNRDVSVMFPELSKANVVDELRLWDTNRAGQARLVFSNIKGKVTIHDQDLWERFLIKGKLSPQQMKEYKAMGLSVNPRDVTGNMTRVQEMETMIRTKRDNEVGFIFNKDGKIIKQMSGDHNSIQFYPEDMMFLKNSIFTHNHPSATGFPMTHVKSIGNSFSIGDIRTAIAGDAAEFRAVTPKFNFVMKRPKTGWPTETRMLQVVREVEADVYAEFSMLMNRGITTAAKLEVMHWHRIWTIAAKKLGMIYEKYEVSW